MKGVILSGGRGTRLRPITHTGPKQLIPIANKPVIQYGIEDLREAGIEEIGVVLGNTGRNAVQRFLGDGSKFGVDITYIVQGNPLGIAHAVGCAQDFVDGDDFVVYLGDNLLKQRITKLVNSFRQGNYAGGMALQRVSNPEQFGVVELDGKGNVVSVVEKPDKPKSDLVMIGIYILSAAAFEAIESIEPSDRGELEITDVFQYLIDQGHQIDSHRVKGWWKDTGKPEDIIEANRLILEDIPRNVKGTVDPNAEMKGRIDLHPTSKIESGTVVRGPVSIDEETVVKSGTNIGPYTSIGPKTTIKDVHIENSIVIGDSAISTNGTIIDSLIGSKTDVTNVEDTMPTGRRLVVGDHSNLKI